MENNAIQYLKRYTLKKNIYLTQRGNVSIQTALKIAKALGKRKVIVQDQGGWITYLQFPERLGMSLEKLKTDDGIIEPNELGRHLDDQSVLLINSLSGYFAEQPMGLLYAMTKQKGALLINDASGSIGSEIAKIGDIVIGSFGEDKPVNLHYGGFLAFDELSFDRSMLDNLVFDKHKMGSLDKQLGMLQEKLRFFEQQHEKIKKDLSMFEIIHSDKKGINVVVGFSDDVQRERIIKYCERNSFPYTECPRYIRVNRNAISIEVKRLKRITDSPSL